MKKILLGAVTLSLLATSAAYAAPMTSMDKGTGKVDAAFSMGSSLKGEGDGESIDFGGNNRYRLGVTYGLGDKIGIDYKYAAHAGDIGSSLKSHQLNLMYQFNPNVAAFAGYVHNRVEADAKTGGTVSDTENGYQVGVLGRIAIAKRTSAWASVGVGNKITAYEIGVGYDLTKNFDVNLFYNDTKYKGMDGADFKTHNVNLGVTYHF